MSQKTIISKERNDKMVEKIVGDALIIDNIKFYGIITENLFIERGRRARGAHVNEI